VIISIISRNLFRIKIVRDYMDNIDIYNKKEITELVKKIIKKNLNNLKGLIILNVYLNKCYGMIIDIKSEEEYALNKNKDIKIIFHIDSIFLYKTSYYDLMENIDVKTNEIHYYNGDYYLNIEKEIDKKDYYKLLEISELIYGIDVLKVLTKGYKITN